jgi:hypothetical protein
MYFLFFVVTMRKLHVTYMSHWNFRGIRRWKPNFWLVLYDYYIRDFRKYISTKAFFFPIKQNGNDMVLFNTHLVRESDS